MQFGAQSRMRGKETPGRIVTNFCTGVGVHDVITSANFYDSRVRGLSVLGGQILGFSIDLHRRPYNTLALTCECVIGACSMCCQKLVIAQKYSAGPNFGTCLAPSAKILALAEHYKGMFSSPLLYVNSTHTIKILF